MICLGVFDGYVCHASLKVAINLNDTIKNDEE